MRTVTINIIQWSDIKEWWKRLREPSRIRQNAKDAVDYVEERWKSQVEKIIGAHYPELGDGADIDRYNDFVIDLKETVSEICEDAKKYI